jgi:hypothetical protein
LRGLERSGVAKSAKAAARKAKKNQRHDGCVDLSGSWVGSCNDSAGDWTEEMLIEQDGCEHLVIGGTSAPIGGHVALSMTEPDGFVGTSSVFPYWNPNMTVLKIRDSGGFRLMGADVFMSGTSDGEMFLMDGKLVFRDTGEWRVETNGSLSVNQTWTECSYTQRAPQG